MNFTFNVGGLNPEITQAIAKIKNKNKNKNIRQAVFATSY